MSPDPGILDMARAGARREEDDVDADIVAWLRIFRHEIFRGPGDAGQAVFVYGVVEFGGGGAGFYFDEGDQIAASCDNIDLADRGADAAIEDAPALEAEPPAGEALASAA